MATFTKQILGAITDAAGAVVTGLTPTIRIRDAGTTLLIITDAAMTEVGDGFYKFDFTTYDSTKNYAIRVDTTLTIPGKFQFATNDNFVQDVQDGLATETNATTNKDEIIATIAAVTGGAIARFD